MHTLITSMRYLIPRVIKNDHLKINNSTKVNDFNLIGTWRSYGHDIGSEKVYLMA
jgi:hypothetical protein